MKQTRQAVDLDGVINPKHEIEILCASCGFDLDEAELAADTCSDCGEVLSLKQNMKIYATSVPEAVGAM